MQYTVSRLHFIFSSDSASVVHKQVPLRNNLVRGYSAEYKLGVCVQTFDWHCDAIDDQTVISNSYRNTQNVRRYFKKNCGEHFKMDRSFMAWMKQEVGQTMAEAADEWVRRQADK